MSGQSWIGQDRNAVLSFLGDKLWHTTSKTRFASIVEGGAILPEPNLPDSERWSTRSGPKYYPFVRSLGGVSLFDFSKFDANLYSAEFRLSNWDEFVPFRKSWGASVWIEIDRNLAASSLLDPQDLLSKWNLHGHGKRIMPRIESAYIGPLPLEYFVAAFVIGGLEHNATIDQVL